VTASNKRLIQRDDIRAAPSVSAGIDLLRKADGLSPQRRHLVIFPIRIGLRRLFSWSYVDF
jgi:hypothetical protein